MTALTTRPPGGGSLEPRNIDEAMRFAHTLAKSSMVPRDFQGRPENILVAIQWGRELGLGPLQALQNIAIINGRPSVWGDSLLALVRGSGLAEYIHEAIEGEGDAMVAVCRTKRRGDPHEIVSRFSVADAKKAGLWSKAGPWTQYPARMRKLRARSFCRRDAYPDVLRGVSVAEELQDTPATPAAPAFDGTTIEGTVAAAEVAPPSHDPQTGEVLPPTAPEHPHTSPFLDRLRERLAAAEDPAAVFGITDLPAYRGNLAKQPAAVQAEARKLVEAALQRFMEAPEHPEHPEHPQS